MELVDALELSRGEALKSQRRFKSSYRNNKCVWVMPVVGGSLPLEVHVSLRDISWPMNTARLCLEPRNMEVGDAYEWAFDTAATDEAVTSFPFIWTHEQDNIQPRDVFFKLYDAMWTCIDCGAAMPSEVDGSPAEPWVCENGHRGLDAVAGLYFTKSEPPFPMAYGNPKSSTLEFRPCEITPEMLTDEDAVMEVNGVAMGCTLWRKAAFKNVSKPWFKTLSGAEPERAGAYTQDLYACRKLKEETDARFAVHLGVKVGHIDVASGRIY